MAAKLLKIQLVFIHQAGFMPVLKFKDSASRQIKEGVERKLIHLSQLMMVIIDFKNGPWNEPEPMHKHIHEQITYVAEGEIIFICEGEPDQTLHAGDMFSVPSNRKHTIQLLSKTARLVDSFSQTREEFFL